MNNLLTYLPIFFVKTRTFVYSRDLGGEGVAHSLGRHGDGLDG